MRLISTRPLSASPLRGNYNTYHLMTTMGIAVSLIREAYLTIATVLQALSTLNRQYQSLLQRLSSPPGLPVPNPTSSYWLDDPPFPELVDIQSDLPETADVVIIGSGITGAAAARTVLGLAGSSRLVVLEARQLCSGATGRNGGHVKVVPYEVFATARKKLGLGLERARAVVRFQMRHLGALLEVGETVPQGEVREVETVDLYLESDDFDKARTQVLELQDAMPEVKCTMWDGAEAREKVSRVLDEMMRVVLTGQVWRQ